MLIKRFQVSYYILILGFICVVGGCQDSTSINGSENDSEVVLRDYRLSGDETWDPEKTYIIHGTLEIPSDVLLEILPGTVVKFNRNSQIKVNGLRAMLKIGTPLSQEKLDEPVYLTSDNSNPQSGDWNGVLFDLTRDNESFLRGVVVEYAKIALDIKTTSPNVLDCTLRNNETAIALDGSDSIIQHNAVLDNEIGISTIGRQNRPQIESNYISNNESGIICENVQSIIQYNNLENNDYSLKLGVKFNLDVRNNWWGTLANDGIDKIILDSADTDIITKQLGTVFYEPIAQTRFSDAGPRE